ncbi:MULTISPECIES: alkaline phosphatase family protein [Paraburkholderia]|uniref:alkaline phosphatase family protein n=1 Tax=Paraburkholderia TaxID=1822464 RepID=UPI001B17A748|nr:MULTISPECIES: alkaline phosphatase family protein [Paraburkholderia]MCX4139816.1 phospholipase [Paraburkholderia aspalathi]MCX4154777.1 phospholipase [Paraburkholderia aspalathi]MDN7164189.1 phospholipase [Paraburkholderia sp. SECH2]MDN7172503.1 phospholipase [Paraburkholderia sp. SEWSISQ10-3 4]MDQ6392674.1 phospholipase [Paraburkholderia aspalathi]
MPVDNIKTIIVVMMENRSFDHVLGYLSLDGKDVNGLSADPTWLENFTNLYGGKTYPIHALSPSTQLIPDPPHDRTPISTQIKTPCANGDCPELGGFVASYATRNPPPADLSMVMGYYTAGALPVYDFFAKNFTICDSWFAPLPTGTQANRLMAMAGESAISDNVSGFLPEQSLVYDWLTAHGASWCVYQSGGFFPFFSLMPKWLPEIVTSLALPLDGNGGRFRRYSRFKEDWTNSSNLPQVIFIEPEYTDGPHRVPNDDHSPTGVAPGQAFLADIYQTISASKRWDETLMIVTYDEHGGFFDHVSPLEISTDVAGYQFQTTGLRVPAFLVSPYVAPGGVFSGDLDHTSILQLLADKFNAGGTYSAPVSARTQLSKLSSALSETRTPGSAPKLNVPIASKLLAPAPVAPPTGFSACAQAFRSVALKVQQDHPELLSSPNWGDLASFVATYKGGA